MDVEEKNGTSETKSKGASCPWSLSVPLQPCKRSATERRPPAVAYVSEAEALGDTAELCCSRSCIY